MSTMRSKQEIDKVWTGARAVLAGLGVLHMQDTLVGICRLWASHTDCDKHQLATRYLRELIELNACNRKMLQEVGAK